MTRFHLEPPDPAILTMLLNKIRMATYTSKRQNITEKIFERFELQHYFQFVIGSKICIHKFNAPTDLQQLMTAERWPTAKTAILQKVTHRKVTHR
ncbi:MAG: hypothetical protein AAFZ17_15360 [Cyanobacteria bacterium J06650_10]